MNNVLKIKFEPWEDFKNRARESVKNAIKNKTRSLDQKDTLIFSSVTAYQKFMTEQKYAILAAIRVLKPTSIYQLAKMVGRDFANVKRDCAALAAMKFITLIKVNDERGTLVPELSFEYDTIKVHMSNMVYSHSLGEAA
jgi:predicted transcriptional regulator